MAKKKPQSITVQEALFETNIETKVVNPLEDKSTSLVKQIIHGVVPSKSNCYKIITFHGKKSDCPACSGSGKGGGYDCPACFGTGKIKSRGGHASLAKTTDLKKYEESFILQCTRYRNKNIIGFFEFYMDVYYPNNKSDLDNSLKVVLDCLQHDNVKAIDNDNKCCKLVINKYIDKSSPRIEFMIREI